uniref:Transducin/WD40 repeat-like superfamily protein n=1 Tax=Heterorhabditis bacteriophora TaxID=37862 RepID=A0A1I7W9Z6_HETBA
MKKSAEEHASGKRAPAVLFSPGGHQLLTSLNGACDSFVLKFTVPMLDIPSEYHFLLIIRSTNFIRLIKNI